MVLSARALVGIVDGIIWIDSLFLKPLSRQVPNLDHLHGDPAQYLREGPVIIGPAKRYATATFLALLLALANWCWIVVLFFSVIDTTKMPVVKRPDGNLLLGILLAGLIVAAIISFLFMLWWWRGGQMVLTPDGVELRHHRAVVWCPWALFSVSGEPMERTSADVLLPVRVEAIRFVVLRRYDDLIARGQAIKCRQLKFMGDRRVRLTALYTIKIGDLAELLLHVGRILGTSLPKDQLATE